jgi:hypothetical protein
VLDPLTASAYEGILGANDASNDWSWDDLTQQTLGLDGSGTFNSDPINAYPAMVLDDSNIHQNFSPALSECDSHNTSVDSEPEISNLQLLCENGSPYLWEPSPSLSASAQSESPPVSDFELEPSNNFSGAPEQPTRESNPDSDVDSDGQAFTDGVNMVLSELH